MFASSSRQVLKTIPQVAAGPGQVTYFSTTSPARRRVLVELLQDVKKLGTTFDRVLVAPGFARNALIPNRFARYVPYAYGREMRKPSRYRPIASASDAPQIEAPQSKRTAPAFSLNTPKNILAALDDLPDPVTFALRTIDAQSKALHGSLTLADIGKRLEEEYGLSQGVVAIIWRSGVEGDRMKALGKASVKVQVREGGREERVISVLVTRLQETVEA